MEGLRKRGGIWWARAKRRGVEHAVSLKTADLKLAKERRKAWLERLDASAFGERPRRSYLTETEETALIGAATPDVAAAIQVAIDTGLRSSEQLSLTWGQIDFERGLIRTTRRTKSGRARLVPMPPRSAMILTRIKA